MSSLLRRRRQIVRRLYNWFRPRRKSVVIPHYVFHFFPFDYSKPLPSGALDKLRAVLAPFADCHSLRITDGTLLGLLRDGKLIPHDNDFDFDVKWTPEIEARVRTLAGQFEWTLGREVRQAGMVQQLSYFDRNEILFDFVFWHPASSFYCNFSEPGYVRVQPRNFLDNVKRVHFEVIGSDLLVPADTNAWLSFRYGPDWRKPASSKGDWKLECGDLVALQR